MLKKKHRLTKKEIGLFFKNKSRFFRGKIITMRIGHLSQIMSNKRTEHKFAFIVSGSPKRRAVERNLLRRRMNEIIRTNFSKIKKDLPPLNITFFYKIENKPTKEKILHTYKTLEDDMINLLRTANIF